MYICMFLFIFLICLFNKKNIHTPRLMNYLPHFRYIALKPGNKSIQHNNDFTKIRAFISKHGQCLCCLLMSCGGLFIFVFKCNHLLYIIFTTGQPYKH